MFKTSMNNNKSTTLRPIRMDVLPASENSKAIYQFSCPAIVGMWAVLSKFCKTESNNLFQIYSLWYFFPKTRLSNLQMLSFTISTTQALFLTHYLTIGLFLLRNPTCTQHYIMIACSPFLQKNVRYFICLLL